MSIVNSAPPQPVPWSVLLNPVHCWSVGFGTGLLPVAPGTWGTFVGFPIYGLLHHMSAVPAMVLGMYGLMASIMAADYSARAWQTHDHPSIVCDEVVGFVPVLYMAPSSWLGFIWAFVLFRLFDFVKPWPIAWLDRRVAGGFGIVLDDVIAGVYASAVLLCLQHWQYL